MRVAAISDIHGNLPALEAVLADIERETVDAIVVVGDSFSGPWPAEVVDLLAEVGALAVHGNADRLDVIASRRQRARRTGTRRVSARPGLRLRPHGR